MKPKSIAYTQLACLALAIALFLWWTYPDQKPIQEIAVEVATTTQAQTNSNLPFGLSSTELIIAGAAIYLIFFRS